MSRLWGGFFMPCAGEVPPNQQAKGNCMKLAQIEAVTANVEQGGWVRDLPNLDADVAVRVRGLGNADYSQMLAKRRSEMSAKEWSDPEAQKEVETDLLVETILVDWEGIDDLPYSKEAAREILSDPRYLTFRRAVTYAATVVAQEGKETLEEDAKNSSPPSDGASRGGKGKNTTRD